MVNKKYIPLTILILANLCLGISGIFPKLIELSAQSIILGRSIVALICFLPLIIISKSSLRVKKTDRVRVFFISILMAGHWVFFYQSVKLSTVSIGAILIYSYPLITAFIEPLWSKQKIKWSDYFFGLIIILSLTIMSGQTLDQGNIKWGIIYGLISACCLAFRNVLIKDINETNNSVSLMFFQNLATFLILVPFASIGFAEASNIDIYLIILVGISSSFIGHTLFVKSLEYYSATSVGIVSSFQVIYAAFIAWVLLNEEITWRIFAGGALIIYVVIHHMILKNKK